MKDEILRLRAEGKSYNEIVAILGCSKGTVSYHCGEGQVEKTKARKLGSKTNKISQKIFTFSKP